jgi:hypothetical protein
MCMRRGCKRGPSLSRSIWTSAEASQLLEFAFALPLLVVLVVGIFDFGGAFNLKHQLREAMREGARYGSSLPMTDITTSVPASVLGAWSVVDSYLLRSLINDCGLASTQPTSSGSNYLWTSTTTDTGGCTGTLTLTIERAYVIQPTINGNTIDVICTKVSVVYPYQWHFNRVIQLLVPGASYGTTIQVAADAVMPNME